VTQELLPILNRVVEKGYQLAPDAFTHLQELPLEQVKDVIDKALQTAESNPELHVIDQKFLLSLSKAPETRQTTREARPPMAARIAPRLEVTPVDEPSPLGDVDGFIDLFNSRFAQLEVILKRRVDVRDAISLSQAVKLPVKSKFKTIGIVSGKRTRSNRLFLELESPEASITVMLSGADVVKKGLEVLEDQVICIDGLKYSEDLLIAEDLIWPDVPIHESGRANEPVCVVIIGDVHVGSKYFRKDLFEKFIKWMNMDLGPQASRELASRVKYVVIAGDLVDGVGIYPDQLDELTITTQTAQYEEAAKLLARLPDYVEIIVIPGNHDAVRRSLPQPPIPESYAPSLYMDKRVHLLPNPSNISLHGVKMLLAHGKALDDIRDTRRVSHGPHPHIRAQEVQERHTGELGQLPGPDAFSEENEDRSHAGGHIGVQPYEPPEHPAGSRTTGVTPLAIRSATRTHSGVLQDTACSLSTSAAKPLEQPTAS